MDKSSKVRLMQDLQQEILQLKESPLYKERISNGFLPVIGEGNLDSELMFIGEAPGRNEAITGRPFCGAAGKILDELLESINLRRESVYITNIVKDRPPGNRAPRAKEVRLYGPFLDRQIRIISPAILATLGQQATKYIFRKYALGKNPSIGQVHGQINRLRTNGGDIAILALYHPAAALYNRKLIQTLRTDFQILHELLPRT